MQGLQNETDTEDIFSQSSSSNTVNRKVQFDVRNPLNLVQDDDDDNGDAKNETEENILLEQDIEGSRPKAKRNNVRLDYDSDSSDDGQTRREKELAKQAAKSGKDSDDDMFSDDEDEAKPAKDDSVEDKSMKLLNMENFEKLSGIEVEESNGVSSGKGKGVSSLDEEDDEEEDEEITEQNVDIDYFVNPDDQDTSGVSHRTKTHEPKLEAFHLRTDMEEGTFDADGNFIRNAADSSAHQDQWLEGVSKNQIKKARLAHAQREAEENRENSQPYETQPELMIKLVELLEMGETPLEALQRLNFNKKKTGKPRGNKFRKKAEEVISEEDQAKEAKRKASIESISHIADTLLQRGVGSIYDMAREEILREYEKQTGESYTLKRKRSVSPDPASESTSAAPDAWEFIWEGKDEIHGPYSGATMKSWTEHNYFDARVTVRRAGTQTFLPFDQVEY